MGPAEQLFQTLGCKAILNRFGIKSAVKALRFFLGGVPSCIFLSAKRAWKLPASYQCAPPSIFPLPAEWNIRGSCASSRWHVMAFPGGIRCRWHAYPQLQVVLQPAVWVPNADVDPQGTSSQSRSRLPLEQPEVLAGSSICCNHHEPQAEQPRLGTAQPTAARHRTPHP